MAKSSAWSRDADNIKLNDFTTTTLKNHIITTIDINLFLSASETDKYFIVGPKGLGKTLLLKLKSLQLREKAYKVIPEHVLCEKMSEVVEHFTYNEIRDLETERMWKVIWEICLCCWIIKNCSLELPEELKKILGSAKTLSSILKIFLGINTKNIEKMYKKYNDKSLRPQIENLQESGFTQVALFIDNIDEAFSDYVGEPNRQNKDRNYLVSELVWIKAQTSILSVAKRLMQSNPHLKIYLSIRSEAFNQIIAAEKLQISGLCLHLKYSKEQIKEIFIKNIKDTDSDYLVIPNEHDHIKAFIGFNRVPHRLVRDNNGEPLSEDVFDYIFRHTFGRPREIIIMGEEIYKIDPKERTIDSIQKVVNEVSASLFKHEFALEIIPYFNMDLFRQFCKFVRINVFNINVAEKAYKYFLEKEGFDHICSYYWNLGLLGIVKQNGYNKNRLIQTFQPVGEYALSKSNIPEFTYFLLHPATYSILEEVLYDRTTFYNLDNIVGYNNEFKEPRIVNNTLISHLQIGLDRDTMSILIPTIYHYKSMSVLISPSDNFWNRLRNAEKLNIITNGEVFEFKVYRDDMPENKRENILTGWKDGQQATVFYTNDSNIIDGLFNQAKTVSLTDYNKMDIFKHISSNSSISSKIIYLCKKTFDNESNEELKTIIETKFPSWTFRLVLIDRYTLNYSITLTDGILHCNTTVESYLGKQVSLHHNQASILPSDSVYRPRTEAEFNFYVREFELLREGIYQYNKYLIQLGEIKNSYLECIEKLEIFSQMQIETLIGSADKDILREVYGKDVKPELRTELIEQCFAHFERLNELGYSRKVIYAGESINIEKLKSQNIFFNDSQFYKSIKDSVHYLTKPFLIKEFKEELQILPILDKYHTTFISYSFNDSEFAKLLACYLILNGVKVDIFQFDDPSGLFKGIMSDYVKNNDRMIFISSENSLKSDACHFELENCRSKMSKTFGEDIIPIMLDDFMLKIEEHNIPESKKPTFWENIKFLRPRNNQNFIMHSKNIDNSKFEKDIKNKIIDKYLLKKKLT